jgi:Flp pilus assembly secretin CpaC
MRVNVMRLGTIFPLLLIVLSAVLLVGMGLAVSGWSEPLSKQVLIEAQIWEISNNEQLDWGVLWDYDTKEDADTGDFQLFSADLRLPVFEDEGGDTPPKGLFASGDVFDLKVGIMNLRVQAALRENRAELLANPKIVVVNGHEASINTGEEVPIIRFEYDGKGNQTFSTVFERTGVILTVRAVVSAVSPEYVLLDIRPEVNEITRFEKLNSPEGEFELPLLTRRTAQSKVVVQSGRTLVIGGLYLEQSITLERGAPMVKDIPVIGSLFKRRSSSKEKRDLLIEIRPTVLLPGRGSFMPVTFMSGSRKDDEESLDEPDSDVLRFLGLQRDGEDYQDITSGSNMEFESDRRSSGHRKPAKVTDTIPREEKSVKKSFSNRGTWH